MIADLDALRDLLFDWETLDSGAAGPRAARAPSPRNWPPPPRWPSSASRSATSCARLIRLAEDAARAAEEAKSRTNKRAELDARLAVVVGGARSRGTRR